MIRFACASGLRPEEYLALQRGAVDFEAKTIEVARVVVDGRVREGEAKTDAALRIVVLAEQGTAALADLPTPLRADGLWFPNTKGGYLDLDNFRRRYLHQAVEGSRTGSPHALPVPPHLRNARPLGDGWRSCVGVGATWSYGHSDHPQALRADTSETSTTRSGRSARTRSGAAIPLVSSLCQRGSCRPREPACSNGFRRSSILDRTQEVAGSSPASSTREGPAHHALFFGVPDTAQTQRAIQGRTTMSRIRLRRGRRRSCAGRGRER